MNTIWRNLLWREWHEHKWKLSALTAIMLSAQLFLICEDPRLDTPQFVFWLLCGAPGAFFIGLHTASGERSAGTLEWVRACPAKLRSIAISKLAMGAVASVAPVAATASAAIVWLLAREAGGHALTLRETFVRRAGPLEDLVISGAAAAAISLSVYLWTAAAGMNQPTELRAALAGAAGLVGWILFCFAALVFLEFTRSMETLGILVVLLSPAGALAAPSRDIPIWLIVVLQLVSFAAAGALSVARFGRLSAGASRSSATAPSDGGQPLAAPRSKPWRAMAWKQWREAAPLGLAGVGLIVGMTLLYAIFGWIELNRNHWSPSDELPKFLNAATVIVGLLVALVVGAVSFAADLQPGLWTFWRSRPIEPALWFWPKYFAGAAAVLVFLDLPLAALYLVGAAAGWRISFPEGILACAPLIHLLAYSAAVCAICWVRRAVYAGILAFAALLGVLAAPLGRESLDWLNAD